MPANHVLVLLGSRWAALEDQATRWREVLVRWRAERPDLRLTLIDWPSLSGRALLPGGAPLVSIGDSWLDGTRLLDVRVPGLSRPTPLDDRSWRRVAAAIADHLDGPVDAAVSANPLWNAVLPHLEVGRTGFDAVDDWRGHPVAARAGVRVEEGYQVAAGLDVRTANSARLADRLARDYGLDATVVPNGVDVQAFQDPGAEAPAGLPGGRFAVYLGVVQERVDVELINAVAAQSGLPVVVAGPASPEDTARLERAGATVLGPVPHRQAPGLLRRASVGLVPHHVNEFTTSMDPMKLLEYLAAGLPVVTTPLPGMAQLSSRVLVADGPAEFVHAVREAADLERLRGADPGVADRDWSTVARRLFSLHVEPGG